MMDLRERTALANQIVALDQVPTRVTGAFYALYPEWSERYGELGRQRCTEDARFHLSFLAGAVQAGRADAFGEYIRWTMGMLAGRKIDSAHLREHLELIGHELASVLGSAAAALVEAYLEAARCAFLNPSAAVAEQPADARAPARIAYLNMALGARRAEAYQVACDALRTGWSQQDVYRELLLDCQRRLGELWAQGAISVAQEHMASAVTQWTLARLYDKVSLRPPTRGRILIAGVEGELHSMPAHFAADLLELMGWDVVFVGTHVPTPAILSAIQKHQPALVGLSVTMAFNLVKSVALIRAIQDAHPDVAIVLGGRAVRGASDLGAELGVQVAASGDLGPFRQPTARPSATH